LARSNEPRSDQPSQAPLQLEALRRTGVGVSIVNAPSGEADRSQRGLKPVARQYRVARRRKPAEAPDQ